MSPIQGFMPETSPGISHLKKVCLNQGKISTTDMKDKGVDILCREKLSQINKKKRPKYLNRGKWIKNTKHFTKEI